jgi:hypothetical protein
MAIDVRALAAQAFKLAKSLTPQAFEAVTVRINPSTEVNHSADSEVTTWEHEIAVSQALRYEATSEREDLPIEATLKNFLVDMTDLPTGLALSKVDQNSELQDAENVIWEVFKAETDPTGSIAIFSGRRGGAGA